jgi:type IV pilus assembly protein PilP
MRLALSVGLLLLLAACGREMADLESYIADVKERPAGKLPPIPEIAPYEPAPYVVGELRDPFVPNEIFNPEESVEPDTPTDGPRPVAGREKEPLEAFPLDSLRMVGSLRIAGVRYALVRSSEPFIYRVRVGDYIGQNHGQVQSVNDAGMVLKELFADGAGRWVERETVLSLTNTAAVGTK